MTNMLTIAPYSFTQAQSGGQRAVFYWNQYLSERVNLFCVSTSDNIKSASIHFELFPILSPTKIRYINPFLFFKLRKIIRQNNIETVILEHPYMGWLGVLLKNTCNIKLVIRSHNIEANRFQELGKWWWKGLKIYEKWTHKHADFSLFITEEDRRFAINNYSLQAKQTSVLPYGTEVLDVISAEKRAQRITRFKEKHSISSSKTLLLFNGVFGYEPNDKALQVLLEDIYPSLLKKDTGFFLFICGKNIPQQWKGKQTENLKIEGFVDDIEEVFAGVEIFLNPIWLGGGLKTKLIEALSQGVSVVSFKSGAVGVPKNTVGNKLALVEDENKEQFVNQIIRLKSSGREETPTSFYDFFNWKNIVNRTVEFLK